MEELAADDTRCLNRLAHLPGEVMTADVLTKLLERDAHWTHREALGYVPVSALRESAA